MTITFFYVFPIDNDVIVSVCPALLMDSTQGVKDFMNYDALVLASRTYADNLLSTCHS